MTNVETAPLQGANSVETLTALELQKVTVADRLNKIESIWKEVADLDRQMLAIERTKVGKAALIGQELLALDLELGSAETTDRLVAMKVADMADSTRYLYRRVAKYWDRLQKEDNFCCKPTFRVAQNLMKDWHQEENPDDQRKHAGRAAAVTQQAPPVKERTKTEEPETEEPETEQAAELGQPKTVTLEAVPIKKVLPEAKEVLGNLGPKEGSKTFTLTFEICGDWQNMPFNPDNLASMFSNGLLKLRLPDRLVVEDDKRVEVGELAAVDWKWTAVESE